MEAKNRAKVSTKFHVKEFDCNTSVLLYFRQDVGGQRRRRKQETGTGPEDSTGGDGAVSRSAPRGGDLVRQQQGEQQNPLQLCENMQSVTRHIPDFSSYYNACSISTIPCSFTFSTFLLRMYGLHEMFLGSLLCIMRSSILGFSASHQVT